MWSRKLYDTDKAHQSLILSADLDFEVLTGNPANKMPQGSPPSLPGRHFYASKNAYAAGASHSKRSSFFLTPARFPDGGKLFDTFGVLGGNVICFSAILGEMVEGPGTPTFADDLVLALHDGMSTAVVEDVGVVAIDGLAFKDRDQREAFVGFGFLAVEFLGVLSLGEL